MRRIGLLTTFLLCAIVIDNNVFSSPGKDVEPFRLGYHRVQVGEEEALRLLVDRIVQGLENRDPYLFLQFVSDRYEERLPQQTTDGLQTLAGDASTMAISTTGPEVLRRAMSTPVEIASGLETLRLRADAVTGTGEEAMAFLSVHRDTEIYGRVRLTFEKQSDGQWQLVHSDGLSILASIYAARSQSLSKDGSAAGGAFPLLGGAASAGADRTFVPRDLSPEHQISVLSRRVTREKLDRNLFSMPYGSALFARLQQFDTAPYFAATYVQLVSDPAWDRIVYGDYQKWVKSYDASETGKSLRRPHGLAVDASGVVYVADSGNGRVLVLRLVGEPDDLTLTYAGVIGEGQLAQPTELAWDDRGTVFDSSDDLLWVVDRGRSAVLAFADLLTRPKAALEYDRPDWIDPSAIAVGRFDGRSDGNLYVADAGTRRVHRFYFDGAQIREVGTFEGPEEMVPSAMATDHWGNIYLSDRSQRQVQKLTPSLEPLALFAPSDSTFHPLRFQPLFGSVLAADAEGPRWTGYDQAFLLENWTDVSGGRRFELGIDFRLEAVELAEDLSELKLSGKLTDPGRLRLQVIPAQNAGPTVDLLEAWANAGDVDLSWGRRTASGEMVPPGYYKLRIVVQSTYERPAIESETAEFYLPLYYYEDSGGPASHDPHLTRGQRVASFGNEAERTVAVDRQEVVYTFRGLDPSLSYEARATFFSGQGEVVEALYAGKAALHDPMNVGRSVLQTDWLEIPEEAFEEGSLQLRIVKSGGSGLASVAQVWLRQANYDPQNPPVTQVTSLQLPTRFALKHNYPNPFNPSTTIEFSIPENFQGHVSLRIYNMLGQTVRELVNGKLAPGVYRKTWNGLDAAGRGVATGVYFYRLQAGTFTETRKLVLIK